MTTKEMRGYAKDWLEYVLKRRRIKALFCICASEGSMEDVTIVGDADELAWVIAHAGADSKDNEEMLRKAYRRMNGLIKEKKEI